MKHCWVIEIGRLPYCAKCGIESQNGQMPFEGCSGNPMDSFNNEFKNPKIDKNCPTFINGITCPNCHLFIGHPGFHPNVKGDKDE